MVIINIFTTQITSTIPFSFLLHLSIYYIITCIRCVDRVVDKAVHRHVCRDRGDIFPGRVQENICMGHRTYNIYLVIEIPCSRCCKVITNKVICYNDNFIIIKSYGSFLIHDHYVYML